MYVRPDVAASAAARESVAARPAPYADADVAFRLLLLGDGGEGYERAPAKAALRDANYERVRTQVLSNRTAITLLGDNIYKAGLPAPRTEHYPNERERAEGIIEHQLELLSGAGAEVIVVPGNHDWDFSGHAGLARIREQQTFVDGFAADTSFLPRNGCPGPLFRDFGERLRVVAIDTEWLLIESDLDPDPAPPVASMGDTHRFAGREREHRDCEWGLAGKPEIEPAMTNELLYERLDQVVSEATQAGLAVVVTSHHPLRTLGPHGGKMSLKRVIFPATEQWSWAYVPVPPLGLLVAFLRPHVIRPRQDLSSRHNEVMVRRLETILECSRAPIVHAAGHEHGLQVFDDPNNEVLYLVSGGAAKGDALAKNDNTVFKDGHVGFMRLDYLGDGRVYLQRLPGRPGRARAVDCRDRRARLKRAESNRRAARS